MRVPARVSEQSIRVKHGDDPEIDTWWRGLLELPCDRDACLFVSVDAADHEFALGTIRVSNLIGHNRSPLNRMAEQEASRMPRRRACGGKKARDRYDPRRASQPPL
jgi:hypothetical protein